MTTNVGQGPPFAACHAALYTTEFLERVLYEMTDCPMGTTTLLLSQRVCHKFRNVIGNFKPIQEELFFKSPPQAKLGPSSSTTSSSAEPEESDYDEPDDPIPQLNPFLSQPRNRNDILVLSELGLSLCLTVPARLMDGNWRNMRLFRGSEELLIYVRVPSQGIEVVVEGKEDMTVHEIIMKL